MKLSRTIVAFGFVLAAASPVWAAPITFATSLSGLNENPPNASPATGFAIVIMDVIAHTLQVDVTFSGLTAPNTAAHIHCCVAPPGNVSVATQLPTFIGFPAGAAGIYSNVFDTSLASTFNPAFVTANGGTLAGAEAALFAGLFNGQAYLNIHTSAFPGGEIRGFLATPEPATLALLALGLGAIAARRRWRG